MAEGLLRELTGGRVDVVSAGTRPSVVRPEAVAVMAERGIDISSHRSKHVDEFVRERFDYVITVCDHANDNCPIFPNAASRLHWSFPDPAAVTGTDEQRLEAFRRVRDAVESQLQEFVRSGSRGLSHIRAL